LRRPVHISATTAHRSAKRDADPDASTETNFNGRNHVAGDRAFGAQSADQHTAPLLGSIVDPADTARRVGRPPRLSQRIHDESDEAIYPTRDGCVPSRPRLPKRTDDPETDVGRRWNVHPKPQVSRWGSRADVVGTHFGLNTLSWLLASLLRARFASGAAEGENRKCHRSTPASRIAASLHVVRSRQSASV